MHVVNPDRVWYEPWRFLMYGFVHNDVGHLITNVITQLLVGLPLELSHSSWRVALVYLFGIMYGGLGREVFNDSSVPLAGASGKTFIMVLNSESLEYLSIFSPQNSYIINQYFKQVVFLH